MIYSTRTGGWAEILVHDESSDYTQFGERA
jgi:hypothetical protein